MSAKLAALASAYVGRRVELAPRYVATINTPGYLPMDDDPPVFDCIADAWEYLADERRRAEEDLACDETCEEGPTCQWGYTHDLSDTYTTLLEQAKLATLGTEYGDTPGYHGSHDLGMAYSVDVAEES